MLEAGTSPRRRMRIPLTLIPATVPIARSREPIHFGVPVPRGQVTGDAVNWRLESNSGSSLPVDARVLDRWPDGSARWVLADTTVDLFPDTPAAWWLQTTTVAQPATTLAVTTSASGCTISTGAIDVTLARGGRFPCAGVSTGGQPLLDPVSSGLAIVDRHGVSRWAAVGQIDLEHQTAGRVVVRVTGTAEVDAGRRLEVVARIEAYQASPVLRMAITLRNSQRAEHRDNYWDLGDPGSILIRDASVHLRQVPAEPPGDVRIASTVAATLDPSAAPIEIYQDSSGGEHWQSTNHVNRERRVPTTFQGYRVRTPRGESHGLRATPTLAIGRGGRTMAAAILDFWQNFPKALESDGQAIVLRLFPGQYADLHELQGGEQKTHDCVVAFGDDPVTDPPLAWCHAPTVVTAAPTWILASGAVDGLAPLEGRHRTLVDQAITGPDTFESKRETIDEYGWRHFGEIYGDHENAKRREPPAIVSHYNNQYDPVAGFILQFMRTGDRRWWAAADELARHVIDIDIYHTTRDKWAYNGGLFWHTYHYGDADTATHRTYPRRHDGTVAGGGPSADHNYPTGLMLRYFLTGDMASKDTALGLAQYVLNLEDWRLSPFRWLSRRDTGRAILTSPDFYGPARSSANSLNALLDGHRLSGRPEFLAKADQLVARVVHPRDDQKQQRLDEPEYRWFYVMFLQALGKYLRYKADLDQRDGAYAHGRESLLAYARWMADHEQPYLDRPEKLDHPTETWAAQDIRKADIFSLAAMHASHAERLRFLERADFFHNRSVDTLLTMPTRAYARPVIVLLTSGAIRAWLADHPDAGLPPPREPFDAGQPERFLPQRQEAERRAKVILAAFVLVAIAAVGWLLLG
jgi:hypothetical protein